MPERRETQSVKLGIVSRTKIIYTPIIIILLYYYSVNQILILKCYL